MRGLKKASTHRQQMILPFRQQHRQHSNTLANIPTCNVPTFPTGAPAYTNFHRQQTPQFLHIANCITNTSTPTPTPTTTPSPTPTPTPTATSVPGTGLKSDGITLVAQKLTIFTMLAYILETTSVYYSGDRTKMRGCHGSVHRSAENALCYESSP